MNVAIIHYSAPPVVGGVETAVARQAQLFSHAGHRVKIIAGRGDIWDAHIPVEKIPLIDLRHPRVLLARASLAAGSVHEDFANLVSQLEADLRRAFDGIDIAILHNVASLNKHLALTQALFNLSQSEGMPRFILWHHDLAFTAPRLAAELHPGMPWDLLRKHWPGASQVVVSETLRENLSRLTGLPVEKIRVISAGLSLADFLGLRPYTAAMIENLRLGSAAPLLLSPVRIARHKNLEQAILALSVLLNTLPEAALVITGTVHGHDPANQEYFNALRDLRESLGLQDFVHFLADYAPDGVPEATINDLYRVADGMLLTSRDETFGMPLLEAGLSGVPIFCTALPPLTALAGSCAGYFSPSDPPETVAGIIAQRLMGDPVYQMRARVRREHTWEVVYHRQIAPLLEAQST